MKQAFSVLVGVFFFTGILAQEIKPDISARVDTSKHAIREIYNLYTAYLNSRPDSTYANPNWDSREYDYYLREKSGIRLDRAANVMFFAINTPKYLEYHHPIVLQIDSLTENNYQIKTIFLAKDLSKENIKHSVPYITNLFASRDNSGKFKLRNTITHRTRDWETAEHDFITYIIHPECRLDKSEAEKAVAFCRQIARDFDLEILPFKYYILPNTDELGKLYNFEYWTYYIGGQVWLPLREIFTTYGNTHHPHEFVHMLFPLRDDGYTPRIINEGLATWLGGPNINTTFEEALQEVSLALKKHQDITLEAIKNGTIRNAFDSNIMYVTGAVICKLAYEKKGAQAIWDLYYSTEDTLQRVVESIFEIPEADFERLVIDYLMAASKK